MTESWKITLYFPGIEGKTYLQYKSSAIYGTRKKKNQKPNMEMT